MTAIPIAIYWSLAMWGLLSRKPVLLMLFFAGLPLGSLAVVPPTLTGGLTFVPTAMTALLLILKTYSNQQRLLVAIGAALDPRRLGLLFLFWLVAAIVTLFMPRLFAGVMIIPLRGDLTSAAPLAPSIQNASQLAYLTISVMAVFAFTQILATRRMRQTALSGLVLASVVFVVTGLLDFLSQYVPLDVVLDPFRTATYALLVDAEMLGGKRVVGLMPEASAFGTVGLGLLCMLYFLRRGMLNGTLRDIVVPPLMASLLILVWMSTSSAAYVGLAVLLLMVALEWLMRFMETRYSSLRRRHLGLELGLVMVALGAIMLIVLFVPSLVDSIADSINKIVLQKSSTSSFEERNMWSAVSLAALTETYGMGVGLGGTRASNSVIATLSNVGIFGSVFYFGFIIQCLLRRAGPNDPEGRVLISGLRYAFLPPFVVGLLVGTTPDFGGFGALRYGLLTTIGMGALFAASAMGARSRSTQMMAPR